MSLRIVPSSSHSISANNTTTNSSLPSKGAPSAPGLHDTLRTNSNVSQPAITSTHPLEARLAKWQATQDQLKMNILRHNFGIGEPVRRGMEMKICKDGEWRPQVLGGSSGVSGDVLGGKDAEICWEDVYRGDEMREGGGFHDEMEGRLRMDW